MSKETLTWLNQNVLVGFTDKRGTAWHYRAADQGDESNHYPGPVPVEHVRRRLFHWQGEPHIAAALVPAGPFDAADVVRIGDARFRVLPMDGDRYWLRSDTDAKLGHHSTSYQGHQYDETLLGAVATVLSDDLGIGSAGLLKGGARAWVQVELPESVDTPCGFSFRPSLLASTSFDSSSASKYRLVMGVVVCDNTLDAAMLENVPEVKVKHSRYSSLKVMEARDALGIIFKGGDAFARAIEELAAWHVTNAEFEAIVAELAPIPTDPKTSDAGRTKAEKKQTTLRRLYTSDARAATWNGSALGVLQTFNTYGQHEGPVRGAAHRSERNMASLLGGATRRDDGLVLSTLTKVTGRSLAPVAQALEA